MAKIDIPFRDGFRRAMLAGDKDCTSRNKRYGDVGDTFEKFGATFEIDAQERSTLEDVALNLFREEGCTSPDHFIAVWKAIHPRAGWTPEKLVWVHYFKRVVGEQARASQRATQSSKGGEAK